MDANAKYQIVSAGYNAPLLAKHNVASFVDINLKHVVQITSGICMIALTAKGEVYIKGTNQYFEVAKDDYLLPKWTKLQQFPSAVKQIADSSSHSLFLTVDGQVFSCGLNGDGQLVSLFVDLTFIGYWQYLHSKKASAYFTRKDWSQSSYRT